MCRRIAHRPAWRERVARRVSRALPRGDRDGSLLTSPAVDGAPADKAALFRSTGAAAVDMESFAVAEVASAHRLPFIAVRVIVDRAADGCRQRRGGRATHSGGQCAWRCWPRWLRLAGASLPPLMRLARRYRAASRSLRRSRAVGAGHNSRLHEGAGHRRDRLRRRRGCAGAAARGAGRCGPWRAAGSDRRNLAGLPSRWSTAICATAARCERARSGLRGAVSRGGGLPPGRARPGAALSHQRRRHAQSS